MIEITRHEQNGILQGFSFWAYPEPIAIVVHEAGLWHSKIMYHGWGSFGAMNQNVEVTGFATMAEAEAFITTNGLIYSGSHTWQTMDGLVVYADNPESEKTPVMISGVKIIQPETGVKLIWGEPEQVIDYIMAEDWDISGLPTWESLIGTVVKKGRLLQHNGKPWIVTIEHTVLDVSHYQPGVAHSLFVTRYPNNVIGPWVQPSHNENSYPKGVRVTHIARLWESGIDANTTVPGQNPGHNYWIDLGPIEGEEPGEPEPLPEWSSFQAHEFQTMTIGTPVTHLGVTYYLIDKGQGFREPGSQFGHYGWSTTKP